MSTEESTDFDLTPEEIDWRALADHGEQRQKLLLAVVSAARSAVHPVQLFGKNESMQHLRVAVAALDQFERDAKERA